MSNPDTQTFISRSESETAAIARDFAASLVKGAYVSLEGDLGAGKTFFARELARALGIQESITSPTFVLQKLYPIHNRPGISQLAHYDFYRITNYTELLDLGFDDHTDSTLVVAEWGDLFITEFPENPIRIKFSCQPDDSRHIRICRSSA